MLQHQLDTQPESHLNQQVNRDQISDQRIEDYLNQLWAPAASALEAARQLEVRDEMRIHIESLIEANIELGSSREHAVAQAIQQFGSARSIQRDWRRNNANPNSMRSSMLTALGVNVGASVTSCLSISMSMRYFSQYGFRGGASTVVLVALYVLPVAAGFITALFAKRKPVFAVLYASLLLLLPTTLVDSIFSRLLPTPLVDWIFSKAIGSSIRYIGTTGDWVVVLLIALPLSCIGAGIVSLARWVKHGPRRIVIAW